MDILSNLKGFDWDEGNITKNWEKHDVAHIECEEVFFNDPLVVKKDEPHSIAEPRYYVLGKTNGRRLLFLVFTVRNNKIRVISARDMNKKERKLYEQTEKDTEI
ncbi:MAG: hypothetical protein A3K50_09880 [Planctomycetes bacterium RIFOXYD12_FULL_42_12]|uniref:BrnT family toxin n=1 Tax=Candidatus Wunengus californicus TaxID=3367619 RepID=UPI0008C66708|nr:BrnT family toxin [Planctomycetota bacterium]OHC06413.1 MAG: hypothetical protein A3J92_03430 [Planctomycetes bacterium RIFOXYC2_FULL_41_27]OHC11857.1 MAG: hypothetical protein A3K50_09880 [Planctomycetes bacterium RIFOXYD12_FULL_42_12]